MRMRLQSVILQIFVACFVLPPDAGPAAQAARRSLVVVDRHPTPVITVDSPGAEGNVYGFENGFALKLRGTYHIFIAEIFGEPRLVNMKLAHWTSPDRLHWTRMPTLYTSSGEFTGKDERAALWGPAIAYDDQAGRWNLFYTAYRSAPSTPDMWRLNTDGKIWRAVSQTPGIDGIGGPYRDVGIVLQAGEDSQPWEGEQGTDSFAPYKVGKVWYSFYGSAHLKKTAEGRVKGPWLNGLVSAASLAGPWKRLPNNPVSITNVFIEAPIVTKLEDGTYVTVFDNEVKNSIGYAFSSDGVAWSAQQSLEVQPEGPGHWALNIRTPLGIIPEGKDRYTLFYTGWKRSTRVVSGTGRDSAVGVVTVRLAGSM